MNAWDDWSSNSLWWDTDDIRAIDWNMWWILWWKNEAYKTFINDADDKTDDSILSLRWRFGSRTGEQSGKSRRRQAKDRISSRAELEKLRSETKLAFKHFPMREINWHSICSGPLPDNSDNIWTMSDHPELTADSQWCSCKLLLYCQLIGGQIYFDPLSIHIPTQQDYTSQSERLRNVKDFRISHYHLCHYHCHHYHRHHHHYRHHHHHQEWEQRQ